jgi:hypothetical protein
MSRRNILELLQVPVEEHDLGWLKDSLGWAVELEFSTIPLYLSGLWSLEEQSGEVYNLINGVVLEEMLHMGLACNMLAALGVTPTITAPGYPRIGLPGGVLPDLPVALAGLSESQLDLYMAIEQPEPPATAVTETFGTIGQFYDAIAAAFEHLQPPISTDGQVTFVVSVPDPNHPEDPARISESQTITDLADVQKAIKLIKDQGEGTSTSPDAPEFDNGELAHYYRFGEIRYGKKLIQVNGKWEYAGDPVPFPACHPVKQIPKGGYPQLDQTGPFDAAYTQLIEHLNGAWKGLGIDAAIGTMFTVNTLGAKIAAQPLPDGSGNYGADFVVANAKAPNSTGETTAVSFQSDIVPLFTNDDVDHMSQQGVNLDQYTYMKQPANAQAVYDQVSSGSMPIDDNGSPVRTWSQDQVQLFKSWMDGGYQP